MSSLEPATRERLELETRVLAAALRLSLEFGDTEGSSLAHEQIFRLLKACQEIGESESLALPLASASVDVPSGLSSVDKSRRMPDIDWFAPSEEITSTQAPSPDFIAQSPNSTASVEPVQAKAKSKPLSVELEETIDNHYELLGAPRDADGSVIHLRFLLKVKRILRYIQAHPDLRGAERKNVLKRLQAYWIAHDVLIDSQTRAGYDERISGSKDDGGLDDDTVSSAASAKPVMRIGELLQSSGLLEKTELEIAADMHKAMPELMFGAFLVKQGFVAEDDLECVLIGQSLIKTGELDLNQFQAVMETRAQDPSIKLSQLLVESGLVSPQRVAEVLISLPVEEVGLADLANKKDASEVAVPAKDPVSFNLKNAIPSWKDQLDWNSPEEVESNTAPVEASNAAPDVVSGGVLAEAAASQEMTGDVGTQTGEVSAVGTQTGEVNVPKIDKSSLYDTAQLTPITEEEAAPVNPAQFEITSENPVITDEEVTDIGSSASAPQDFIADTSPIEQPAAPVDADDDETAPRKARRHSLLDLMVDLVTPELKDEAEEPGTEPLLSTVLGEKEAGDLDTVLFGPAEPETSVAVAAASQTEESEVLSDDFEMLKDAVEMPPETASANNLAALSQTLIEEEIVTPANAVTGPQTVVELEDEEPEQVVLPVAASTVRPARPETAEEVFFGEEDDVDDVAHLDMAVDEILDLPDPGDVAASEAAALAAAAKDTKIDSWSIVSMPASYLASYLLDEDEPAGGSATGSGNAAGTGATQANNSKKHLEPPDDRERGKFRRRRGR